MRNPTNASRWLAGGKKGVLVGVRRLSESRVEAKEEALVFIDN
jgi:hypothetical protein